MKTIALSCGAAKNDFILTAVTNLLSFYKRNAVAIFVDSNRAGDAGRTNSYVANPH